MSALKYLFPLFPPPNTIYTCHSPHIKNMPKHCMYPNRPKRPPILCNLTTFCLASCPPTVVPTQEKHLETAYLMSLNQHAKNSGNDRKYPKVPKARCSFETQNGNHEGILNGFPSHFLNCPKSICSNLICKNLELHKSWYGACNSLRMTKKPVWHFITSQTWLGLRHITQNYSWRCPHLCW